ncbi:MAG: 23S rRNA (pseudouridine(1915)-N(3))-methyltransferase RlmH [Ginsengibacter sp.]
MKIHFWAVGKPHETYVKDGIDIFLKRTTYYFPIEWKLIASPKNAASMAIPELKKAEGESILHSLQPEDVLIVLDIKGKQISSEQLAGLIQQKANASAKNIIFLIGGAFGLDDKILARANFTWSLSPLVFPHQLVRLILAEQVYRACTIIRNEKYHHS